MVKKVSLAIAVDKKKYSERTDFKRRYEKLNLRTSFGVYVLKISLSLRRRSELVWRRLWANADGVRTAS